MAPQTLPARPTKLASCEQLALGASTQNRELCHRLHGPLWPCLLWSQAREQEGTEFQAGSGFAFQPLGPAGKGAGPL